MSTGALNKHIIDTTLLDQDTYYPVVMSIGPALNARIEVIVALDSDSKPNWSTHPRGFSCRFIEEVNGFGWGTSPVNRTIYAADYAWTSNNINPIGGVGQLTESNYEYIYVRGGGKYHFYVSDKIVPVLIKTTFTAHNQSISPTKTPSFNNVRTNFLSTDLAPTLKDIENKIALEVNKIQIGGRNLAKNSTTYVGWRKNFSDLDINASTGVITLASNGAEKFILPTEGVIMGYAGQQYTASYKVKCEKLDKGLMIPIYHDGKWQLAHYAYIDIKDTKGDWIIISKTFTPQNSGALSFAIDNYKNTTGIMYAKEGKLELGNIPTDWSPAPEDTAYEEGTWTPVVQGSSTQGVAQYTVSNARYVRTGNMITAFFNTSGKFTTTPTGTCVIKGLPYQGGNNANGVLSLGVGYAEQNVYFAIDGNTLVSKKQNGKNSGIVPALFGTDLNNTNFYFYGNVSYFIG